MRMKSLFAFCLIAFLLIKPVLAHEEDVNENTLLESFKYIVIASILSGFLVVFSILYKTSSEKLKIALFLGISIPIAVATIHIAVSTIYLNLTSETGGPVHWHADFEVWNCGNQIDLIDPKDLSNRVGTSVSHEHGDNRIHIEGVLAKKEDASLHRFFEGIGGVLTEELLITPTNEGTITIKNNDSCQGKQGKLQVFLYRIVAGETKNWIFVQEKLENFEEYVLSPYANVPPGDCIIIEFGEETKKTNHICKSYEIAIGRGELTGG